MLVPGSALPVTSGQTGVAIPYPTQGQSSGPWASARLQNASPYPMRLYLGGAYLDTLQAWTCNVYPLQLNPGQSVTTAPLPLTYTTLTPANTPPAGAGDSTLYTDFGLFGDTFPGSYPFSLAAQAVASAVAGTVFTEGLTTEIAQGTTTAIGGAIGFGAGSGFGSTIPTTTRSLLLILQPLSLASGTTSISFVGATGGPSNQDWYLSDEPLSLAAFAAVPPIYFPFYGAIDDQIQISCNLNNGADNTSRFEYWLLALPDADLRGSSAIPDQTVQQTVADTAVGALITAVLTPAALVPAPANGAKTNRVRNLSIYQNTTNLADIALLGATSGQIYWKCAVLGSGSPTSIPPFDCNCSEGINAEVTAGTSPSVRVSCTWAPNYQ